MGMTNAEKQEAWRSRRDARLQAEHDALKAEIAALREQLCNRPVEPKASSGDEAQAYLDRLEGVERLAKAIDALSRADAIREHRRLRNVFVKFDRALRALEQTVGAPGRDRKRAKIQALADHGGTPEHERRLAVEHLARLDAATPPPSVTDPQPLPKTRDQLLARRRTRPTPARHPA